ncbi:reverse transcriptase domain-containing protein, partial [Tanacetum coccineum]
RKDTTFDLLRKEGTTRGRNKLPEFEKLILALVHAGRRLQRYFQGHPIRVLTDKPIKQILTRPAKLVKIDKWAIELVEHDIKFIGSNSVKGKILADFLAKTPFVEDKNKETKYPEATNEAPNSRSMWKLYTNRASSSGGSGASLMLVSSEGKECAYALRFKFETTTNEAEYEALLAGLRIAEEIEIKDLAVFVDSQLVANQVKGLFEARQTVIKQYLENTKEVLRNLDTYSMEHIRRNQNKKADT